MAIMCFKPKGSCKTCEHYRIDEDFGRKCCFVSSDAKFKAGDTAYFDDVALIVKHVWVSCDCISYECVRKDEPQGTRYNFNEKVLKKEVL